MLFARFGDLIGRKSIFLLTLVIMGLSTVAVGLVPTSDRIGLLAPILVLLLRIFQGLAISGEFGGAVIYVAEHAPPARRGWYAGWIPATVGLSVCTSISVLLAVEWATGPVAFKDWGWRLPFILSAVPLGISVWIRMRLQESPAFLKMKAEGRESRAPIREAFGEGRNIRRALVLLFGLIAPHSTIGYLATFYTLVLLTTSLKVDTFTANTLFVVVMFCATGLCVLFSWLSDRIGRKPVILAAFALAAITYFPIFTAITRLANPVLAEAQRNVSVVLVADPKQCSLQFNPAGTAKFSTACDRAKLVLAKYSVSYRNQAAAAGAPLFAQINSTTIADSPSLEDALTKALIAAGYPRKDDPNILRIGQFSDLLNGRVLALFLLLLTLTCYGQMGQGPSASAMVEIFPTRIRYTGVSLPFQIGTGWFGGLLPAIMVAINAEAGNLFAGLWYPIVMLVCGFAIGLLFLPETKGCDLDRIP